MWWLVYRRGRATYVFIVPAGGQYTARLKAGLAGLPTDHFAEALELDNKIATKVPKEIATTLTRSC